MRGRVLVTLAAIVLIFSVVVGNASAQTLSRVVFNGWTQVQDENNKDVQYIAFIIYVTLYPVAYAPDFVEQITISAPDGTELSLDPDKDWLISDWAFYKRVKADSFDSKKIPTGNYTATVVPKSGSGAKITEADYIRAVFMSAPEIIYPTADLTGVPGTPTFKWTGVTYAGAITGAVFYRVLLRTEWGDPVFDYYDSRNNIQTDRTSFKVPKGVLKANTRYRLQIQARGDSNDLDVRSQTSWVYFTTGSW
jgi:hypothetical protein